ncbi:ABC transporter permease [Halorarius halobius]|uniref:ABC transporter permease n=1 Tax=Halorarius halobius TaxID=2962671 RepID=UPI0020CB8ABC|nr:ABC transporter permease subunit [Halorarius halobius]
MATSNRIRWIREWREIDGTTARIIGIIGAIGSWFALASVFPNQLMPYPYETFLLAWGLVESGVAFPHLSSTLYLTLLGFLGSLILGTAVGVFMGVNSYSQKFFTPYVITGLSIPAIAWAAVMTLIFGYSIVSPVTATILTTFPYIAINIWKGVEGLEADLIRMSKAFNISKLRMLRRMILPSVSPSLFTAGRFGLAISWKIVTISEIFAASLGVGYKLMQSYQLYNFEEAWAWATLFMVVILIIEYGFFKPLQRRVFAYRQDADFELIG